MPGGVDATKFSNADHKTPKYQVLRILSQYNWTPQGLKDALPELQALDPDATIIGNDRLSMPNLFKDFGGGDVDVLQGADAGGLGWWWGAGSATGGNGAAPPAGTGGGTGTAAPPVPGGTGTGTPPSGTPPSTGGGIGGAAGLASLEEIVRQILSGRGALGTELEGDTETRLRELINRGGNLDEGRLQKRIEGARDRTERARRAQMEQAASELAARGLSSMPGVPQGEDAGATNRISENISGDFSTALRDIEIAEGQAADERLMNALELSTGMTRDRAQMLLGTMQTENQRQAVLAQIAMEQLKNNTQWNMFLAQYGLDRDKFLYDVMNGNLDALLPIFQQWLNAMGVGRGGHAPDPNDPGEGDE